MIEKHFDEGMLYRKRIFLLKCLILEFQLDNIDNLQVFSFCDLLKSLLDSELRLIDKGLDL